MMQFDQGRRDTVPVLGLSHQKPWQLLTCALETSRHHLRSSATLLLLERPCEGDTGQGRHLILHGERRRPSHSTPAHGLQLPVTLVKGPNMWMKPLGYCSPIHSFVSVLRAIYLHTGQPMELWKTIKRSYQATMLADNWTRTQQVIIGLGIKYQWEDVERGMGSKSH